MADGGQFMPGRETVLCPSCGYKNRVPTPKDRCASCGATLEELGAPASRRPEAVHEPKADGFSILWFAASLVVVGVLTVAVLFGMPMAIDALDFEGQAGMLVAIPTWLVGGLLVGLISPGQTFAEPVAAVLLIAVPTALWLHEHQTVKAMPLFMYLLLSALGLLFALIGAYLGERLQHGPGLAAPPNE